MDRLFSLFDTVWHAFTSLDPIYQAVMAGLALYIPLRRYFWPGWRLLRYVLYRGQPLARLRALLELLYCLFYVQKTGSLFQAARLRVELEMFNPRPAPLLPCAGVAQRLRNRRDHLRDVLDWRSRLRNLLAQLAENSKQGVAEIRVRTCFDLYKVRDALQCYFTALAHIAPQHLRDRDRCVARLRIEQGCVAPLYLLTGLLDRYDQDWSDVIDDFGRAIAVKDDVLADRALRRLQAFLFDCWLLWGPSIPVCECDEWSGVSALQYGYGDENNSIPLFGPGLVEELRKLMARVKDEAQPPVAFQASITGVPCWGPNLIEQNFCVAQQALRLPERGLLLEFVRLEEIGAREEEVKRRYYSAYLWVMFVICAADGEPIYPQQSWRALLPIYEHGNIADGKAYATLKRQLARKALGLLHEIVAAQPALRFRCVCAFDETLCDHAPPFAPPVPLLRTLLIERAAEQPELAANVWLDTPNDWKHSAYSACHLPKLITDYYEHIKGRP
jgi:hypothetical protein